MERTDRERFQVMLANIALDAPGDLWFAVDDDTRDKENGTGLICDLLEDGNPFHRVTHLTMRSGVSVLTRSAMGTWHNPFTGDDEDHLLTADGLRLYMSPEDRARILAAYKKMRIDEITSDDALAILECALFGQVVYR
jgi:hypothetical protein